MKISGQSSEWWADSFARLAYYALVIMLLMPITYTYGQTPKAAPDYFPVPGKCNGVRMMPLTRPTTPTNQRMYITLSVWHSGITHDESFIVERLVGGKWEPVNGADPAVGLQQYLNVYTRYDDLSLHSAVLWERLVANNLLPTTDPQRYVLDITDMLLPGVNYRLRNKANVFHLGYAFVTPPTPPPTMFIFNPQNDIVPTGHTLDLVYMDADGTWKPMPIDPVTNKPTVTMCKNGTLRISANNGTEDFYHYTWNPGGKVKAPNNVETVEIHEINRAYDFTVNRNGVCSEKIKTDFKVKVVPQINPIVEVAGLSAGAFCGNQNRNVVIKEIGDATALSWGVKEDGKGIYDEQTGSINPLGLPPGVTEKALPNPIAFSYHSYDPLATAAGDPVEHELRVVATNQECAGIKTIKVKVYPGVIKPNIVSTPDPVGLCSPVKIAYKDLNENQQPKGVTYFWEFGIGAGSIYDGTTSHSVKPTALAINKTATPQNFHSRLTVVDKSKVCKVVVTTDKTTPDYPPILVKPEVTPRFDIVRTNLVPKAPSEFCTPQKLELIDKSDFTTWREWRLIEPAEGTLPPQTTDWSDPHPSNTNAATKVINPWSVDVKRTRYIQMRASNGYCEAFKTTEIMAYPPPKAGSLTLTPIGTSCWPYKFKLKLDNIENTSSIQWRVEQNGGLGASNPAFGYYEIKSPTNTWEQEFELSNAENVTKTWTVVVTLHSIGDDCPLEYRQDIILGSRIQPLLECVDPIGCTDENGMRKVQITDKSEIGGAVSKVWKVDGVVTTPTQIGATNVYEFTLTHPGMSSTPTNPIVSLELVDSEGCMQKDEINFTLYPPVVADFVVKYTDVNGTQQVFPDGGASGPGQCADFDGIFTSSATGATRLEWTVTDGTNTYHGAGQGYPYTFTNDTDHDIVYTVILKAYNDFKCMSEKRKDYLIHPAVKADFTVEKIDECNPYKIKLIDQTSTKVNYTKIWDVDGGLQDPLDPDVYIYTTPGTKTIKLKATGGVCVSESKPYTFKVLPPVVAAIATITPGDKVCAPAQITFTNASSNATRNEWTFEVGTSSSILQSGSNITYTYTNPSDAPKTVNVLLQAFNERNCKAEATAQITVYPEPRPENSFKITDKCNPLKLEFLSNSPSLSTYEWIFTPTGVAAASGTQVIQTGTQTNPPTPVEVQLTNSSPHDFVDYQIAYKGSKDWGGGIVCAAGPIAVDKVTVPPRLDVTIGLKPRPDALDAEVCSDESPIIFDIHTKGGTRVSHKWDFDDGGNALISNNEEHVEHQFENKSQEDKVRNVKIISVQEETSCTLETKIPIIVHPEVLAQFTKIDGDICQTPRLVTFTNISRGNVPGTDVTRYFDWDYGYMEGGIQQKETKNTLGEHTWTFSNHQPNTNEIRTVTLSVREVYASGKICTSKTPATSQVMIAPRLNPVFTVDKTIACIPFTVLFSNNSTGAPQLTYIWDYADGGTSSDNNPTHTHNYNNISLSSATDYQVKLTIENTETRCTASTTQVVTACPKVTADFAIDNTTFCTPGSVVVQNHSQNADTYNWNLLGSIGGTIPPTYDLNPVTIPLVNSTNSDKTVKLQLIATHSYPNNVECKDTKEQEILLHPEIIADFDFDDPIGCSPMNVKITNKSRGAVKFRWFVNGLERPELQVQQDPNFTLENNNVDGTPRDFEVRMIAMNGDCSAEVTKTVKIYPKIISKIILNKYKGCTPLVVDAEAGEQKAGYTYEWSAVQGTVSQTAGEKIIATFTNATVNPAVIVNGTLKLKVYFTDAPQCKDESQMSVEIHPGVYPDFIIPAPGCSPYDARFHINTNVFASPETEYTWSVDDVQVYSDKNQTPTDPQIRLVNNDNFLNVDRRVKLHVRSVHGCEAEIEHPVTVYPKPKALFQVVGKSEGCPPFDVDFQNQSKGTNLSYTYDFGDGSSVTVNHNGVISKQYSHNEDHDVAYTVKLKAVSQYGCQDEQTSVVTVYPAARADFEIMPNDKGCSPLVVTLQNRSNRPVAKTFIWNFGDGTVPHEMNDPEHTFENLTINDVTYTITLLASTDHGCESVMKKDVTVYATPKIRLALTPMLQVFPNATINISNLSDPAPAAWKFHWSFGDGNTSLLRDPPQYTYARWGLKENDFAYDITLRVASPKCTAEKTIKAYILPPYPDPAFTAYAYEGCVPFRLNLRRDENLLHDDETYLWDFGDGTTSTEKVPIHDYTHVGTYHVKLTVTGDGGVNYAFAVVTVLPNPVVKFNLYPDQVMLPKATIKGQNLTEGDNLSFVWDFGDGSVSTDRSPIHDYLTAGKFLVTLEGFNRQLEDCRAKDTLSVIVRPAGHLVFPNVFQPSDGGSNGGVYDENDRANEVFHPYGEGVADYTLRVYDRWGELIFESNDIKKGWDGYYNNKLCETSVYTWRAQGHFFNGEVFDLRGNVTLLRK